MAAMMQRGRLVAFDAGSGERLSVGTWDRFATLGYKEKNEQPADFTPETLTAFVRNWYARGQRLSMCLDHTSALGGLVPAPAAAFYDALAVVDGGKVVEFKKLARSVADSPDVAALAQKAARFATDDDPQPTPDGLWCFRCEVTPLGEHPTQGLRNYRGVSPFFTMDGKNEQGEPIGPVLFDVAAVNANFQAGCELSLGQIGAQAMAAAMGALVRCPGCGQQVELGSDGAIPVHIGRGSERCPASATKPSTNTGAHGAFGANMNPEMMKKMGLAEGCSPADKMAAYGKYAYDATPDELATMAADLEKDDDEKCKAMAGKFRKMAAVDADDEELPPEEKQAHSALAALAGVPATSRLDKIAAALAVKTVPHSEAAALRRDLDALKTERAAEKEAVALSRCTALADRAEQLGYTAGMKPADAKAKREKLIALARTDFSMAESFVNDLPASSVAGRRTAHGAPVGKPAMAPVDLSGNDAEREVDYGGQKVIERGGALSAAAEKYQAEHKGITFAQALVTVAKEQPHLFKRAE